MPIERSVMLAGRATTTSEKTVNASITIDNKTYDEFESVDNANEFISTIEGAGENSLVVLDGRDGEFVLNDLAVDVANGQTVAGGGTSVLLTGPNGQQAVVLLPGQGAQVHSIYDSAFNPQGNGSVVNVDEYRIDPDNTTDPDDNNDDDDNTGGNDNNDPGLPELDGLPPGLNGLLPPGLVNNKGLDGELPPGWDNKNKPDHLWKISTP